MRRTAWFREAGWGLFFHFLAARASSKGEADMTVESWNARVDAFDVEGLAEETEESGAAYLFITIGQGSGYYLSPNETYDRLVPREQSRLSRRDLVQDLASALDKRGIRLMVYLPSRAPYSDEYAIDRLGFRPLFDASETRSNPASYVFPAGTDTQFPDAQRNWEAVVREWSARWGDSVHGWWIDGCYFDKMYRRSEAPNFESFAGAMRAGNPESIVAFNPGVVHPVRKHADCEDYTAGELAGALPIDFDAETWAQPVGGEVDGAQYHVLCFLGQWWGVGAPRLPEGLFVEYTRYLMSLDGVFTWDIPPAANGRMRSEFLPMLKALRYATR
jgi:hypothetical protein